MKRTHGQSPHVLPSGITSDAVRRISSRTRARCVGGRLDDEPRGSSEGGKRNRHLFDLLVAGNALTVARSYGQHQPAGTAVGPNASSIPETGITLRTAAERMKSHWSALRQLSMSHRASGDHAIRSKSPAPVNTRRAAVPSGRSCG